MFHVETGGPQVLSGEQTAAELFAVVESGAVTIPVNQRFALADAAEAHRRLEGRMTTVASVLIP